jgi:UDP-hydrolysing UDP-N-acetyl-D-glucosamine 2-epimerase
MKRICVVLGSRANYSSIKSAMSAIQDHPDLELQVIATASTLLGRYGVAADLVEADGFHINARVHMIIEGETPHTMAKSTGLGLLELPSVFDQLQPDFVLTVGDRFETMATTVAAAFMNIPLVHTMGGEVTGTIDESIRHAITKFAHVHFPASPDARDRILRLGEKTEDVHLVGCPRVDLVKEVLDSEESLDSLWLKKGVGAPFDPNHPFLLVSQHPVTTEFGSGEGQILETLEAVKDIGMQAIVLWPNADAGSEEIAKGVRKWREAGKADNMHFFKNLPTEIYIRLMERTSCLVGNSSSGIREGAYIGTPVVNIGSRQDGRERGKNVIAVDNAKKDIRDAIDAQILHGKYEMDPIYGDGRAGERIADIMSTKTVNIQKRITY